MKKLTVFTVIMFILIILAPCINATIHTEKQSNETGRIHGNVYEASFFESPPIILAKLVLETEGIKKTTFSGILGGFQFNSLPIGLTYSITVSHHLYHTKVYTYTLSSNKPDLEVAMNLYRKDDSITKDIYQDESYGGTIFGYTLESHDTWGAYPVPLALVDAGIKQTISGPVMGYYRITGLPFDQEITIYACKKGYDSDILKYTFTELRPTYYYCFDLQGNEDVEKPKLKTSCIGKIYGSISEKTKGSFEHEAWTFPFIKILTEGKTVYGRIDTYTN
jgi:hypothetical protein